MTKHVHDDTCPLPIAAIDTAPIAVDKEGNEIRSLHLGNHVWVCTGEKYSRRDDRAEL